GSTLVPLVTELKQNYPNPFKGITNISWILEKDEPISVDIYNLKGQKVKSFYNGLGKKGRQVLSWDAKDNNGQSVASGIYFYRLNTPEGSKVQKMMVMR
ncbi:MAG: T9SS type A sorting domain-containing protein, partial [Candidatus Cloacimonetes bacterium]|nr:T9SS type A sorting domain-containing protein [Candidatus Cloacimonadota bacterium]